MKSKVLLPNPSSIEVNKYLTLWDSLDNYTAQERSLKKLFTVTYPTNDDLDNILIKVCSLNTFYNTNIYSPYKVASHIYGLGIDEYLDSEDLEIVNRIAQVQVTEDKVINFYSFATKYCSHHKPTVYPIYDYYVKKVLNHFKRQNRFAAFADDDLMDYSKYKKVLIEFSEHYSLTQFNMKQIDKYLWQLGKEYFPRNYKNKTSQ